MLALGVDLQRAFDPAGRVSRVALSESWSQEMAVDLSMSVLVVDDYATMIRIIRNLLKQLGFENIDDASDGSAALTKMRAGKRYGLVISDWNMEPMTGYDLLREVRADPNLATTAPRAISAGGVESRMTVKADGISGHFGRGASGAGPWRGGLWEVKSGRPIYLELYDISLRPQVS